MASLTVAPSSRRSSILVLLLVIMIFSWEVSAGTVSVVLGSYLINEVTDYQWAVTGLTNGDNSPIRLQFPANVVFDSGGSTALTDSGGNVLQGTLSVVSSTITITSPPSINNSQFTFRLTNIKNPYYKNTFTVYAFQGATQISSAFIVYEAGPIKNCTLTFAGVTGQLSSNATLDFITTNPINNGQVTFDVYYGGTYNQSTNQIIDNRASLTCTVTINNVSPQGPTPAIISNLNQPPFACTFIGLTLLANSSVRLFLDNVRNPPYKSNYFLNEFYVSTRDATLQYDSATKCAYNDVVVDSYAGNFNQATQVVNTVYSSPIFSSVGNITKNFNSHDTLLVVHDTLEMNGSTSIAISRIASGNSFIYNYSSGGGLVNLNFAATSSVLNTETDRIQLNFANYNLRAPPSTSAVTIYFRFFKKGLQFMQIYAPLSALASQIASANILITPGTKQIGSETIYAISLNLTQPLSSSSFILIDFPIEIGLSNFTSSSVCQLVSSSSATVNCILSDAVNKIIRINISGALPAGNILVRLGNIMNPDNPEKSYNIIIETYNNQSDSSSKVESAPIITLSYTSRIINLTTSNTVYTVNHQPSTLVIFYTPGVRIPSGSLLTFDFSADISQPVYKSASINSATVTFSPSKTNNTITLTASMQILSGSNVTLIFQFKAPSAMGTYNAVNVSVSSNSVVYQASGSQLAVEVGFPASQVFTIAPSSLVTGVVNSYTFSFYTNVAHPNTFYLLIFFPTDTKFSASTVCSPSTVCSSAPTDQSNVTHKVLAITMIKSNFTNSYSLSLSSITNSRKTGTTLPFAFQTKTLLSGGSIIIVGSATTTISLPNTANVTFDKTKSYYRANIEPVSFSCIFFNKLEATDYLTAEFDYRTYSQNSNSTLSCLNAACSISNSTGFTTTVKIVPSSVSQPISVWIEGLISSTTTLVTDSYEISVRSYSGDGQLMDLGKLKYNLSCIFPTALLNKNCRTCSQSTQLCQTCYSTGYFLFNGVCVTNCGNSSMYQAYPGDNSTCQACQTPCSTCISLTQCLTCVAGHFMYDNGTCKDSCITVGGLYIYNVSGTQLRCRNCWSSACITCTDGGSTSCTDCGTAYLQGGRCETNCDLNSNYIRNVTSQCLPCNNRCFGCTGSGPGDCIACKGGYFNVSGLCESSCPNGTVSIGNNNCGCDSDCNGCQLLSTRCLACKNSSKYLYNYQCVYPCPSNSYNVSSSCYDCSQGCLKCTLNACTECLPNYNVYQNKCFSECNSIGERFSAVGGVCIECAVGCDVCDASLNCSVCLGGYTLMNQTCKLTCEVLGNCEPENLVPDKIMPIPGFITTGVWLVTLGVLKIFFLPSLYIPYSYIFIGSVIEFVLVIASLAKMNTQIQVSLAAVSRLLASSTGPQQYMYSVLGLLASSVALNYVSNIIFLVLFCKYLKKYIGDRQIDKISNYLVLTVGAITNYRFSLVAYSKMFPKPNILVENQSKLTPIHYMCISSLFVALLPLSAAGILIYNEYPLTDLFMLGIDLLIIVVLQFIFTIWMVSVDKKEEYFQGVRKYQKQEFNKTLEGLNEKEDFQNVSNAKLAMHISNISQTIQPQEIDFEESPNKKPDSLKSDNENDPLPMIPNRKNQLNLQTIKVKPKGNDSNDGGFESQSISGEERVENLEDQRTIRNSKNKIDGKKKHGSKQDQMASRQREVSKNFGKEKKIVKANQNKADLNIKINMTQATSKIQRPVDSDEFSGQHDQSQDTSIKQANSEIMVKQRKQMKPQTQRSSGILPATMMQKKQSFGLFDSQKANSQIDEIDFESLIQTRMVDRSQNQNKNKTKSVTNEDHKYEEVSPSWFNEQNQRFDYDDSSEA